MGLGQVVGDELGYISHLQLRARHLDRVLKHGETKGTLGCEGAGAGTRSFFGSDACHSPFLWYFVPVIGSTCAAAEGFLLAAVHLPEIYPAAFRTCLGSSKMLLYLTA